jgi:WD repeat-containing protein 68
MYVCEQVDASCLTIPLLDPLYGLAFSKNPTHPLRVATTTLSSNITNKLLILDIANKESTSPYSQNPPSSSYNQLASANLSFPATKVGWEPGGGGRGVNDDERIELLATTGDILRIWDLRESWEDESRGRGYARGNGWSGQSGQGGQEGHRLEVRSVLSNVGDFARIKDPYPD